jgi:predicted enzyme related to lactoylglutathione lyase
VQNEWRDPDAGGKVPGMAIAQFPTFVIDCPDANALAEFYAALLDWNVKPDDDWVEIRPADGSNCISFQRVEEYRAPEWPSQTVPQQMHIDVQVHDLDEAEAAVIELGAVKSDVQPGTTFRVFLDPAGHPFCLCLS